MMFAEMVKSARLRAGDPDQPRDDDGKWTDGGGGEGTKGKPQRFADRFDKRERTPAEKTARVKRTKKDHELAQKKIVKAEQKLAIAREAHQAAVEEAERVESEEPDDYGEPGEEDPEVADARAELEELIENGVEDEAASDAEEEQEEGGDETDEEEVPRRPATEAEKLAAHEKLRAAEQAASERADRNALYADRLDRASEAESDAQNALEEAEEDLAAAETAARDSENMHELARISEGSKDDADVDASILSRVDDAKEELRFATKDWQEADAEEARMQNAQNPERYAARRELQAAREEADRIEREREDGPDGEPWHERARDIIDDARDALDEVEARHAEEIAPLKRATEKADARRGAAANRLSFWRSAYMRDLSKAGDSDILDPDFGDFYGGRKDDKKIDGDEPEGTAEDRDGDGRTGEEEEQDDEDRES